MDISALDNSIIDDDGIIAFSQNRTLYVDQFTGDKPKAADISETFRAKDLTAAFEHYRPEIEVELRNESGESVLEQFRFLAIEDFEDEELIKQSKLLSAEEDKISTYGYLIYQFEKNNILRRTLANEIAFSGLKESTASMLAELQKQKAADYSIKQDDYQLLKSIFNEVSYLDPGHAATKNIFLSDPNYADIREKLANKLLLWSSVFANEKLDLSEIIEQFKAGREEARLNLQNNLLQIHEDALLLEVAYRTLDCFFNNANLDDTEFITLMNISNEDLLSVDSNGNVAIQKELKAHYDALSLKDSYSLLVIPGYIGSPQAIKEWAKTAFNNKVLLVTDFKDCLDFMTLNEELNEAHLQDSDVVLSNIIVSCNYLIGRKKSELANEYDDVCIPGSGALAGRLANTKEISIAQGVVGKDYGFLNCVKGTRLHLLKAEIAVLINHGVIPLVETDGRTYAYSNRSLYNGSTSSLQEYPIVRVMDWVNKVLMNYIHDIALETWDYKSPQKLENKIRHFLDHYRGYQLLFSNYNMTPPEQNPVSKVVSVNISITPYYSNNSLVIKLEADNKDYISASTNVEN